MATSRAPAAGRRLGGGERLRAAAGRGDGDHHVGGADPARDAGAAVPDDRHRAARPGHRRQHVAGAGGGADAGDDDRAGAALVGERGSGWPRRPAPPTPAPGRRPTPCARSMPPGSARVQRGRRRRAAPRRRHGVRARPAVPSSGVHQALASCVGAGAAASSSSSTGMPSRIAKTRPHSVQVSVCAAVVVGQRRVVGVRAGQNLQQLRVERTPSAPYGSAFRSKRSRQPRTIGEHRVAQGRHPRPRVGASTLSRSSGSVLDGAQVDPGAVGEAQRSGRRARRPSASGTPARTSAHLGRPGRRRSS